MAFTRALLGLSLAFLFLAHSFAAPSSSLINSPADVSSSVVVQRKEDVAAVEADVEVSPSAKHHLINILPGKYPVKYGQATHNTHDYKHSHTLFDHIESRPVDHDGPLAFLDHLSHSFRLAMCNKFGLCMPLSKKYGPIHFPSAAHFPPHDDHEDTDEKRFESMFDKWILKPIQYDNNHVPHHMPSEDCMHHHDNDKHHSNEGHYESSHKPGYQNVHHSSHKPETYDHHISSHQSNPHGESSHKPSSGHSGPVASLLDTFIAPMKVYKPVSIVEEHHGIDHRPPFPPIAHHGSNLHGNHHHDEGYHSEGHDHHGLDHHEDQHTFDEDSSHHQGGHQHPIEPKPHHYVMPATHKPLFRLPWLFPEFTIV